MSTETEVVVVGGGATGVGVARDLAMRGVDVTLVERGTLNAGTTGRSHGVLHSGARYADVDPEAARECVAENRVLKRIGGACVADTGGYVVRLAADDAAYFDRKLDACRACGIEAEVLDGDATREREAALSAAVDAALAVPDAVVSPARLVAATVASAREHGARFAVGADVTDVRVEGGRAVGVEVTTADGETTSVRTAHVVNAAGAWAGRVAALADVDVAMRPTQGAMVVVDHPGLGTVLNRSRPPADGDIVVPRGDRVVVGTTSHPVDDPDATLRREPEPGRLVTECAAMLPGLDAAPVVRRYRGVRPLYEPDGGSHDGRAASRGFALLDHATRDGLDGFTTIVGGKLTTSRLMAEAAADAVCDHLGVDASCRTAQEPLPGADDPAALDALVEAFGTLGPADESLSW